MLCLDKVEKALIEYKRPYYQNIHKVLNRTPLVRDVIVIITQMVYSDDRDVNILKYDKKHVDKYNAFIETDDTLLYKEQYQFRPRTLWIFLESIYYNLNGHNQNGNNYIFSTTHDFTTKINKDATVSLSSKYTNERPTFVKILCNNAGKLQINHIIVESGMSDNYINNPKKGGSHSIKILNDSLPKTRYNRYC